MSPFRSWRPTLLAAAIASTFVAGAQAGEHVDWLDDGTVLLKLGPDYGDAVIETSRAELGSLFGPDARPYAGATIRVLSQDEGPKGAISGPLLAFAPVFEELSGAKVELDLVPVTNLYSSMMLDLQRGEGRYDATLVAAYFYGELIDGNFIRPSTIWRPAAGSRAGATTPCPTRCASSTPGRAPATASPTTPTGRCSTTVATS
jgi:hypothetical protein